MTFLGRKTQATDPDLGMWSHQYDDADRLTQVTDAKNQVTRYTYDLLGHSQQGHPLRHDQAVTTTYVYDQLGYNVGHLTVHHRGYHLRLRLRRDGPNDRKGP